MKGTLLSMSFRLTLLRFTLKKDQVIFTLLGEPHIQYQQCIWIWKRGPLATVIVGDGYGILGKFIYGCTVLVKTANISQGLQE